jgi:hypothetical protein
MATATDTFPTSVGITKVCLGEKSGTWTERLNGEVISSYPYRVRCYVYIVTRTNITRGLTDEPNCTSTGDFTAFTDTVMLGNGKTITVKFGDAVGTVKNQRASRKNEANFWELEETEETRQGAYLVEV